MKTIGVIIPTFNRAAYLRTLMQQLARQEKLEDVAVKVVVVVDGSTDGTIEMLSSEFPAAHVVQGNGTWWWTKSVNEGAKFALELKADYLLLLNDDSQVDPYYIYELIQASRSAGEKSIIGSISITDKEPRRVSFSGVKRINWLVLKKETYFKSFELLKNIPSSGLYPTYALNGRGTFIQSSIMRDLNYLNEHSFPQYGSDDDLALRAWKEGYKVLLSYSCKVIDRAEDTSKGTAFRKDSIWVFVKSFFLWTSVNYLPKQLIFFYRHGIKVLLPFYLLKFIAGTSYAYFFKYKRLRNEL